MKPFEIQDGISLSNGGSIETTSTTTVIAPPGALEGQSLVIRPTNGTEEDNHIHLVAGNPATVDLYLGDDDQYVKIERDSSNVVIGTNANSKHWTFDYDGNLAMPGNTIVSAPDNTALRIRTSGSAYGATTLEYVNNINGVTPYNSKVRVAENGVSISTSGDTCRWLFDPNGTLTIPNNGAGDGVIYSEAANVQLYTNKTGDARVNIRAKGTTGDKTWAFKDNGEIQFPDTTLQTTAYRNRPLNNLNLDGGSASVVFEVDLTYIECGGSYLRGILLRDVYDGNDGGSTITEFDKILDGGQS